MMLRYKDRLICRYLDGLMNQTERQAFLRRLEVDTSLRETLRLEENIRAMMLRDAASIPAMEHVAAARANALSTLVVTPPPQNGRGKGAGENTPPAPFSSGGFSGGMAMKALLGVLLAGAIIVVVATLFNRSDLPRQHDPRPAETVRENAPGMEGRSGMERNEGSTAGTIPADRSSENERGLDRKGAIDGTESKGGGAERSAGREEEERISQRTSRVNLEEAEALSADGRERQSPRQSEDGKVRKENDPAHTEQSMRPTQSLPENAQKPPVFQSNHIRPSVKIDSGRK